MRKLHSQIYNRDIYNPGTLTELAEQVIAGTLDRKDPQKLTDSELAHVPKMYACLPLDKSIIDISGDEVLKDPYGKEFLAGDLKALTMLIYNYSRSAYWNPKQSQVRDTSYCGGVPLYMLGLKRFRDTPYSHWQLKDKSFKLSDEGKVVPSDSSVINKVFELDLMLGHAFASTEWNNATQEVVWKGTSGLAKLSYYGHDKTYRPTASIIHEMRELSVGKSTTSFATYYGSIHIALDSITNTSELPFVRLYNTCSIPVKLMLLQRWVFYPNHRNDDMITDYADWDNKMTSVDGTNDTMGSYKPKNIGSNGLFGLFGLSKPEARQ